MTWTREDARCGSWVEAALLGVVSGLVAWVILFVVSIARAVLQ